jgi:hypothetical protein
VNLVIGLGIRLDKKIFNQSSVNVVPEDVKENQNVESTKLLKCLKLHSWQLKQNHARIKNIISDI